MSNPIVLLLTSLLLAVFIIAFGISLGGTLVYWSKKMNKGKGK